MKHLDKIFEIKNKNAIVTGATGYLGKTICNTLAELGANIIMLDNFSKDNSLKKITKNFKKKYQNQNFYSFSCDLSLKKKRKELATKLNRFKKIDIVINNAAFTGIKNKKGYNEKFEKQNVEMWNYCFEVSLTAIFDLTKLLLSKIKKSKSASIINISSIYGVYGPDWSIYKGTTMANPAAYAASKGGLIQLTKWLSKTLGPKIRVNAISPGGIFRNQPKKFVRAYIKKTSLKRMAVEKDFIGTIALLSSNASSYITGQNIIIDGGWGS